MVDMAEGDPRLWPLIRVVERYNSTVINKSLALGADLVRLGDDLGLQAGLPMSPAMWRRYIKPSYGLSGLVELVKGKVAIHIDLDRQLFPFATPAQIEDHIGAVFEALYLPQGGLMIHAECEPDVSLENIDVICTTLGKICQFPL